MKAAADDRDEDNEADAEEDDDERFFHCCHSSLEHEQLEDLSSPGGTALEEAGARGVALDECADREDDALKLSLLTAAELPLLLTRLELLPPKLLPLLKPEVAAPMPLLTRLMIRLPGTEPAPADSELLPPDTLLPWMLALAPEFVEVCDAGESIDPAFEYSQMQGLRLSAAWHGGAAAGTMRWQTLAQY